MQFDYVDEELSVATQLKIVEHSILVVMFVLLYTMVPTQSVDETLKSDHSNESY